MSTSKNGKRVFEVPKAIEEKYNRDKDTKKDTVESDNKNVIQ